MCVLFFLGQMRFRLVFKRRFSIERCGRLSICLPMAFVLRQLCSDLAKSYPESDLNKVPLISGMQHSILFSI
jgi:hypothetical protein